MDVPFLDVLDGISPWWWVTLAIVLAGIEAVTVTTVLIWSAAAALVAALALWIWPRLAGEHQIAIFALASIGFIFVGRALVARFGRRDGGNARLNRRAEQLVGREGVVSVFDFHDGKVTIDGVPWPARLEGASATPAPGDRVRVVAADGIVIWVRPL